jgi:hypothetical protein
VPIDRHPRRKSHLSRWYEPCSGKSSNSSKSALNRFKPLSPETINAETAKPSVGASICQNQEILSQCNRCDAERLTHDHAAPIPRGDELEMNL